MTAEQTALEFVVDDRVDGQPLTPSTVDLSTLRGLLEDLEKLIKGDEVGASLAGSRVVIEEGSLRFVTIIAPFLAASLVADLSTLAETGDLDAIQVKRAQIIESWQTRARRSPSRSYSIATPALRLPLRVSSTSELLHRGEQAWVGVEKYLVGKVVDLGGKQNPNVHVVLSDSGESLRIGATEEQLAREQENLLYRVVTIQVQAEQHLRTRALRNLRLLQFLPQPNEVDEQALERLWARGREAWKDVDSAADWVEGLRGNA
jgi:hypothetical protein